MNTVENCRLHPADESVEEKLACCLRALLDSAQRLKTALVERNVNGIWDALGEQEEQAALLNEYSSLWQEMNQDRTDGSQAEDGSDPYRRMRVEMKRLQALQRANSMLAQSFLSAMRKAMDSVTQSDATSSAGIYSKLGRQRGRSSRLLHRYG